MARTNRPKNAIGERLAGVAGEIKTNAAAETAPAAIPAVNTPDGDDVPAEQRSPDPETLRGPGRPRKDTTIREPGSRKGLQPGQERFTVVGDAALLDRLRDYAYTERITLRAALDRAIRKFLKMETERGVDILHRPD